MSLINPLLLSKYRCRSPQFASVNNNPTGSAEDPRKLEHSVSSDELKLYLGILLDNPRMRPQNIEYLFLDLEIINAIMTGRSIGAFNDNALSVSLNDRR